MSPEYITLQAKEVPVPVKINQLKADIFSFGLSLIKIFLLPEKEDKKILDEGKWNIVEEILIDFFEERIRSVGNYDKFVILIQKMLSWKPENRPDLDWLCSASKVFLENEVFLKNTELFIFFSSNFISLFLKVLNQEMDHFLKKVNIFQSI